MNVLNLEHISKVYGDKVIFDDISCGIHQGDKIGIIGINGTGKTTFLRILAGLEEADEGQVITQNGLRITYLPQHPQFPEGATILSYDFPPFRFHILDIHTSEINHKILIYSCLNRIL